MTEATFLQHHPDGVLLFVKLQPRASREGIEQALGNELKIKVTAPPVDSAANTALVKLLAKKLGLPKSQVELVRGHSSRHKVVKLHGAEAGAVRARLQP